MDLPGGSERKVSRKQRLRIPAKTYNQLIDFMSANMRKRGETGGGPLRHTVDPNLTVLVENVSGADIRPFRALKLSDVSYNPANNGLAFNMRPVLQGATPDSEGNAVAITKTLIEDTKIDVCVIKGICVAKVKINSASHDWAKPVDGQTYLESAESGPARLLWYGVVTDSIVSGGNEGDGDNEADEEDVYYAVIDLIGSNSGSDECYSVNDDITTSPETVYDVVLADRAGTFETAGFVHAPLIEESIIPLCTLGTDPDSQLYLINGTIGAYAIFLLSSMSYPAVFSPFVGMSMGNSVVARLVSVKRLKTNTSGPWESEFQGSRYIQVLCGQSLVTHIQNIAGFNHVTGWFLSGDTVAFATTPPGSQAGAAWQRTISEQLTLSAEVLRGNTINPELYDWGIAWEAIPYDYTCAYVLLELGDGYNDNGARLTAKKITECVCTEPVESGGESGESGGESGADACCTDALEGNPNLEDSTLNITLIWNSETEEYEGTETATGDFVYIWCDAGVWNWRVELDGGGGTHTGTTTAVCDPFSISFTDPDTSKTYTFGIA